MDIKLIFLTNPQVRKMKSAEVNEEKQLKSILNS